jgi:hypothetical protein
MRSCYPYGNIVSVSVKISRHHGLKPILNTRRSMTVKAHVIRPQTSHIRRLRHNNFKSVNSNSCKKKPNFRGRNWKTGKKNLFI